MIRVLAGTSHTSYCRGSALVLLAKTIYQSKSSTPARAAHSVGKGTNVSSSDARCIFVLSEQNTSLGGFSAKVGRNDAVSRVRVQRKDSRLFALSDGTLRDK